MFKNILVPTDGSALSEQAIEAAVKLANENGSRIVGLAVAESHPYSPLSDTELVIDWEIYEEKMRKLAEMHVQKIAAEAEIMRVPCEAVVVQGSRPYEEIVKAADQYGCDLIFMASHGRTGLNKLFTGSETQKVLAAAHIPVLVFRS